MSANNHRPRPFRFTVHVTDARAIKEGVMAAGRVARSQPIEDQLKIGRALAVGRRHAMTLARVNAPQGRGYNEAFNQWLGEHPALAEVDRNLRTAALWAIDHYAEVEVVLNAMGPQKRQLATLRGIRAKLEAEGEKLPARSAPRMNATDSLIMALESIGTAYDGFGGLRVANPYATVGWVMNQLNNNESFRDMLASELRWSRWSRLWNEAEAPEPDASEPPANGAPPAEPDDEPV